MIEVTTDETQVVVKIKGEGPAAGWTFSFRATEPTEYSARLLAQQLQSQITAALAAIRAIQGESK